MLGETGFYGVVDGANSGISSYVSLRFERVGQEQSSLLGIEPSQHFFYKQTGFVVIVVAPPPLGFWLLSEGLSGQ